MALNRYTKSPINTIFLLQEKRSKKIPGIANIKTYKDNQNHYLIEIKPGIAFPGTGKIFNVSSLNNKLSLATTFTSEFDNVKVKNICNVSKGQIKKLDGSLIKYDKAKYVVENKGMVDIFDTLISRIGKKIYILTRKNGDLNQKLLLNINED